ncbi:hypothetical protein PGQ11_002334 [Apiospora arundinis]|uniref:Transposase n=1 Tax=Apiospora arundinis TaxID=335852 RepID=A0ABR2JIQ3_9PEZI
MITSTFVAVPAIIDPARKRKAAEILNFRRSTISIMCRSKGTEQQHPKLDAAVTQKRSRTSGKVSKMRIWATARLAASYPDDPELSSVPISRRDSPRTLTSKQSRDAAAQVGEYPLPLCNLPSGQIGLARWVVVHPILSAVS